MIVLALIVIVLGLTYWSYTFIYQSPHKGQNNDHAEIGSEQGRPYRDQIHAMTDELNAISCEWVSIRSFDGLKLVGRYYPGAEGAPLAICCHGYRGNGSRDFCVGAQLYMRIGFHVLLIDQRAHMRSEGHSITFGVKERRDCLSWVNYAVGRLGGDTKIILAGISMGAATVLMASALPLPENVCGIAADCPYTSPRAILSKVSRDMGFPPFPSDLLAALAARMFAGFGLNDADSAAAVKSANVPILLIHGEDDRLVPCDMSRSIYEGNPSLVSLHTFPGAGHGLSYYLDPERYARLVTEFATNTTGFRQQPAGV